LEDLTVPAEVGIVTVAAVEDSLLLRVWSRTWRLVPRQPSCPTLSPRV
jgi:hypothetical protein